jgi:hypothetical protein
MTKGQTIGASPANPGRQKSMSYFDEVLARAKRRRSPWNLLLIPAVLAPWLLMSWATSVALATLSRSIHAGRDPLILPHTIGGILIAVAPLFAWLGPSMIIGNLLVAAIPPARRVLDAEAVHFPGTDRRSANRSLLRVSIAMTSGGLLVALVGALIKP